MKQRMITLKIPLVGSIIFLLIIGGIFMGNYWNFWNLAKQEIKAIINQEDRANLLGSNDIESEYNNNFFEKRKFINLNGAVHKTLNQKIVNGAIKGKNDKLYLEEDIEYKFDKQIEIKQVDKAVSILQAAKDTGADVLYVQRPMKFIEGKDALPYGMNIEYNKQYDLWCNRINQLGIDVVDLRKTLGQHLEFYKTDHHWTVESSFYAAGDVVAKLKVDNVLTQPEVSEYFNRNQYILKSYGKCFLGSEGVKTGEYYVGMDNFNILIPKFPTNFSYKHYISGELQKDTQGTFCKAFVDEAILKDDSYYNKYNACLYGGYVENIIQNNNLQTGQRVLLISDSYARPMTMYLSSAFSEVYYLDPQEGRYNDSYIAYIKKVKPDIVIMMYTGKFINL